ncbi:MAG TPA: hypothetical protein VFJ76_07820 [Solirubrobacterales bacterium]|nr:hypothetical protein [Solirubrobacterales bacterium]
MTVQELEALCNAPAPQRPVAPEACAALRPHVRRMRVEGFEAAKKADRLGEGELHTRLLLLLAELDDLRIAMGEDLS